jgi:WD40 repeat protein
MFSPSLSPADGAQLTIHTNRSWSTDTGHPLLSMSGHSKNVFALALSHDGRYIASASADYSVRLVKTCPASSTCCTYSLFSCRIWDAESGAEIGKLDGHNDWACALAFSPFSRRLVSGGRDSLLKVWDTETGEELETLRGHKKCILQVRYSPDGRFIVSASEDKTGTCFCCCAGCYKPVLTPVYPM